MIRFRYAGASHAGLIRSNNEDAGFVGHYLLVVADGVGGAAAGEIAAASAAYVVTSVATITDTDDPLTLLGEAVRLAHDHLAHGCEVDPDRGGMSTTLTALLCDGQRVAIAHIGDSRAYRWHAGVLTRLTADHTLVQSLIDDGHLTDEQAAAYPYRSVVIKALDGETVPEPDLGWVDAEPGDRLLVCSDGLTDLVDDDTIGAILSEGLTGDRPGLAGQPAPHPRDGDRTDLDTAVDQLIDAALHAGGRDNVTCLIAEVVDGPRIRPFGRTLGAFAPTNLIDATAVHVVHTADRRTAKLEPA